MRKFLKNIMILAILVSFLSYPCTTLAVGIQNEIKNENAEEIKQDKKEVQNKIEKNNINTTQIEGSEPINNAIIENKTEESQNQQQTSDLEIKQPKEKEAIKLEGNLEVDLEFSLPIKNTNDSNIVLNVIDSKENRAQIALNNLKIENEFAITLNGKQIKVKIRKLDYEGMTIGDSIENNICYYGITFYGLLQDTYSLELAGEGYQSYTVKDISIQEYSKRVTITNKIGLFAAGDVNADGIINQQDVDLVIQHINTNNKKYDLNRDGLVDIVDLTYIAENINGAKEQVKIEDTTAIVDVNTVTIVGDITEEKAVENLFTDSKETVKLEKETAITEEQPAKIDINFATAKETEEIRIEPSSISNSYAPVKGTVEVTDIMGQVYTFPYDKTTEETGDIHKFTDEATEGTIVINLGKQVAVKKVTIKVTQTNTKNTNLAEIAKVEFLNNVYEKVPAPKMDIPTGVKAEGKSEQITVSWNHAVNITGYEVKIEERSGEQILKSSVFQTTFNSYSIHKINNQDIENYKDYYISVQSVNGEWKSGYSEAVKVTPIPNRRPPAPENIVVTPKYARLDVSWKKMKDTLTYNLYYREKGTTSFEKVSTIQGTSYTIDKLKPGQEYEIYITGNNHLGEGAKSQIYTGTPTSLAPTITENYKLINTANGENVPTSHIKGVTYPSKSTTENFDEFDIVDNDYTSYWNHKGWETGGFNNINPVGPIVELDDFYEMDHYIVVPQDNQKYNYGYLRVGYWDENGKKIEIKPATFSRKTDKNGKTYYYISLGQKIKTNKIQTSFALPLAYGDGQISISEMKFYYYDSIEDEIAKLFTDDLRIELAKGVTLESINELRQRANTIDPISEEYHPNRSILLADLEYAEKLLNDTAISDVITVDQNINNGRNSGLGFAMSLNDMQPLGVVANAGEQIAIYVGTTGNVMPQVVFTQYYPESGRWSQTVTNLKKGQNIITVPTLTNMDVEKGGSVYIRYPNATATNKPIKVRVSGGQKIPVLDLHEITEETEAKQKIKTYIEELNKHVSDIPNYYAEKEETYHPKTSILNSTELVTKNVILSVPATQTIKGIGSGEIDKQVDTLYNSMTAFEEMMDLFYRQKGLSANSTDAKDRLPGSRISIRYGRMFDGAFMYAGGQIIGIEYGSVPGLMRGYPAKKNGENDYTVTGYFGWGISHEIGHVTDTKKMIYGETSNNILALLAQTADDKQAARLEGGIYQEIYNKVTSHTTGIASNVFVTLGMFWQLHLAYDDALTLTDENSIFARLMTLYRHTDQVADKDNLLIRLASEAAGKDLTEFFDNWGLKATEETKQYIASKGLEKETRAIYYLNDGARRYRLTGGKAISKDTKVTASLEQVKDENGNPTKDIKLDFRVTQEEDKILGYEIKRNGISIAFIQAGENTYIDPLNALNNRVFEYEVVAYDKLLNKTESVKLDPIKIEYDGQMSKKTFGITSNVKNDTDNTDLENPEYTVKNLSVTKLIDEKKDTIFNGNTKIKATDKTNPYVVIELNSTLPTAGIKYTAAVENGKLLENTIKKYQVYVSTDNQTWDLVKTGTFDKLTVDNPTQLIYFDKPEVTGGNQLYTAMASYVKIVAVGNKGISGAELDLIAPPGDNIDVQQQNIGILEENFTYAEGQVIPKGSVVFKGDYRGNPAFNIALVIDGKQNTINLEQIFMAELPDNAEVDEIASGAWIGYMSQEEYRKMEEKIKINLYRVNNAETAEGQRLVSDTQYITLKPIEELPKMVLTRDNK